MSTTDLPTTAQPGAPSRAGLIAYFARNPVAANLLMVLFIVGGIISGSQIPIQRFQQMDLRMVTVTVPAPGSSPQEVEEDINRRIEENILGLSGVERVITTATHGLGRVDIEIAPFARSASALLDVQNAVDSIERFPPANAEQPEVRLQEVALEVVTLAVSSSRLTEDELRVAAESVRGELLQCRPCRKWSFEEPGTARSPSRFTRRRCAGTVSRFAELPTRCNGNRST